MRGRVDGGANRTYSEQMAALSLRQKLTILADAAKYDASCASSGGEKRTSKDGKGVGSVTGHGICHSFTPDGRCVSLLKILMTNACLYDCAFCINRRSAVVIWARERGIEGPSGQRTKQRR